MKECSISVSKESGKCLLMTEHGNALRIKSESNCLNEMEPLDLLNEDLIRSVDNDDNITTNDELDIDFLWEEWEEYKGDVPFWQHICCGSMAGIMEHVCMYPVDTVKTHFQTNFKWKGKNNKDSCTYYNSIQNNKEYNQKNTMKMNSQSDMKLNKYSFCKSVGCNRCFSSCSTNETVYPLKNNTFYYKGTLDKSRILNTERGNQHEFKAVFGRNGNIRYMSSLHMIPSTARIIIQNKKRNRVLRTLEKKKNLCKMKNENQRSIHHSYLALSNDLKKHNSSNNISYKRSIPYIQRKQKNILHSTSMYLDLNKNKHFFVQARKRIIKWTSTKKSDPLYSIHNLKCNLWNKTKRIHWKAHISNRRNFHKYYIHKYKKPCSIKQMISHTNDVFKLNNNYIKGTCLQTQCDGFPNSRKHHITFKSKVNSSTSHFLQSLFPIKQNIKNKVSYYTHLYNSKVQQNTNKFFFPYVQQNIPHMRDKSLFNCFKRFILPYKSISPKTQEQRGILSFLKLGLSRIMNDSTDRTVIVHNNKSMTNGIVRTWSFYKPMIYISVRYTVKEKSPTSTICNDVRSRRIGWMNYQMNQFSSFNHCTLETKKNLVSDSGPTNQKGITRNSISNLYKGVNLVILGCIPAHALYFSIFEYSKKYLSETTPISSSNSNSSDNSYCELMKNTNDKKKEAELSKELPANHPLKDLNYWNIGISGFLATLAHDLIITPIDTLKQRIQLGINKNGFELFKIIQENGIQSLYLSFPITLLMNIPYQVIMICTNEKMKELYFGYLCNVRRNTLEAKSKETAPLLYDKRYMLHENNDLNKTHGNTSQMSFLDSDRKEENTHKACVHGTEEMDMINKSKADDFHRERISDNEDSTSYIQKYNHTLHAISELGKEKYLDYKNMYQKNCIGNKNINHITSYFVCAGIGGGVAAVLTNPFDVIKTRIQTNCINTKGLQIFKLISHMYRNEGIGCFFRGSLARMALCIPASGISWGSYDTMKRFFNLHYN